MTTRSLRLGTTDEARSDLRESALRIWTALHAADQARGLYGSMPELWFAYLPVAGEWAPADA